MSILIEGLPNDIAIRCLARVPYYLFPKLEIVSHSWWAAVHSTEFYKARQAVNSTESLLCICTSEQTNIWQLYDPIRDIWLTLPVLPSSEVRNLIQFGVVSVSGKLFVLGGWNLPVASVTATNEVWAYDPISRKWAQRAPMTVPRARFVCCVWNGKILVAGGFSAPNKSTSKAEIYDPDTDTWDPIPDLERTGDSACIGFVIDGAVHVVNTITTEVQVLENLEDKWQRSHSLNHAPELITVVNGLVYGMNYYFGYIYKLECGIWKVVASALELKNRMGYAVIGFRNYMYFFGGLVGPGGGGRGIKPISDVDVLLLGNENEKPVWKKVASMTGCQGVILGCAFALRGFCDDIYVIGGVVLSGIKNISDVDVLLLGNENEKPVWKKVASMTPCQGKMRGCAELRI